MHQQYSSVVPLRWLSERQRNQLVAHIRSACTQVLSEWGARKGGTFPTVCYARNNRAIVGHRFNVEIDSKVLAAWSFEADTVQYMLHLPLGSQVSPHDQESFEANLELDLVTALSRRLLHDYAHDQIMIHSAPLKDAPALNSKGTCHVFDIGNEDRAFCFQLEISSSLVDRLIPRTISPGKQKLASRRAAIGNEIVELKANLGQIDLSFNELHGLRVGDVLVIDQSLNKPITIHTTAGKSVADATLGRHKTQLALQIATLSMPNLSAKRSI